MTFGLLALFDFSCVRSHTRHYLCIIKIVLVVVVVVVVVRPAVPHRFDKGGGPP
jgi:hypothetical protein